MKKYDIILWDVDQTLLDFKRSEDYALRQAFSQFGKTIDTEVVTLYSGINDSYWKRLEKGEITRQEVILLRFVSLFERLSITDIEPEAFAGAFQKWLGSVYFYKDDSYRLCVALKKDYRQYVVSNGVSWTQRNKLKLAGFDRLMDDIFISEEIGSDKPFKEFFDRCFEKIPDFKRERTIIVGDSQTSDMLGGNRAKIACCWYNPEGIERSANVRVDYEIKNLWEIREVLNGKVL